MALFFSDVAVGHAARFCTDTHARPRDIRAESYTAGELFVLLVLQGRRRFMAIATRVLLNARARAVHARGQSIQLSISVRTTGPTTMKVLAPPSP